jgi:hypothetical protein
LDLSEQFDAIAEDAAVNAEALFEMVEEGTISEDLDGEKVEEEFTEIMKAVIEGLEIYTDLTEDEVDEAYDPRGKPSAAARAKGRSNSGSDSTEYMDTPRAGNFPPRPTPKFRYSAG